MHATILAACLLGGPADVSGCKLADCAWLAGVWQSESAERSLTEEHWSAPAGGAMMGMFRMQATGRTALYEFLLLEESAEGVTMRLRHYGPEMADRDKAPFRLKLTAATPQRLDFTAIESDTLQRIIYERGDGGKLSATVETKRSGRPARFQIHFNRRTARE